MYYPYIRAKQFELLALKELSPLLKVNKQKISPIIEPVRNSSTLKNTLKSLKEIDLNFNFVINPLVWDLNENDNISDILDILESELDWYNNYQICILMESEDIDYYSEIINTLKDSNLVFNWYTLIHNKVLKEIEILLELIGEHKEIINNVINVSNTNSDRRYYRKFDPWTRINIDDYFQMLDRNADYLPIEYSPFSSEYKYYKEEWYKWFGDFLIIGDNYSEWGFRPYAVVIHISDINSEKEIITRHFVSDSNGDVSDVAGKFAEANKKLVDWIDNNNINQTEGLKLFKELYESNHFPWLWVLKKLSIMHHIELLINNI